MIQKTIALSLVVTAALSGTAGAAAPPDLNEQDRRFLAQAHQDNLAEIAAGRAAQRKGQSRTVRAMGARLIADHTRLDADLAQVARRFAVELPDRPSMEQRVQLNRVSAEHGALFDWAWTSVMIISHRTTLARGTLESENGSSPEVRRLAADAKPVVRRHLRMLQEHAGRDDDLDEDGAEGSDGTEGGDGAGNGGSETTGRGGTSG